MIHGGMVCGPLAPGSPTLPFNEKEVVRENNKIYSELRYNMGSEATMTWRKRLNS
jgi:hypothetical protein